MESKPSQTACILIIIWWLTSLFLPTNAGLLSFVGVQSADTTVGAVTLLSVYATIDTTVDSGGWFEIRIPSTTSISSGALSWTMTVPSSISVSCTGNSAASLINVTLANQLTNGTFFNIDVAGFTNPDSTLVTDTFQFQTFDSTGALLDFKTSGIYLTATAGSLTSSSIEATDPTVAALNTINFNFTTTHKVVKGGTIQVTIPKWNPNAQPADIQSMIQGSVLWAALENLEATISWVFDSSTDILTVSNAFSGSDIPRNTIVRFSCTGVRNPISTADKSGFTITTFSGSGGTVDSSPTTLKVTSPAEITLDKLSSLTTKIVQEETILEITFRSPVPLDTGCILVIEFPVDLPISTTILKNVRTVGLFGTARNFTGVTYDTIARTVTITDGCQSYVDNTISGILQFINIENPISTKPTDSIILRLSDSGGNSIAEKTSGIQYVATFGTMASGSMTATPTTIGSLSRIAISLFPSHKITTAGALKITFPNEFTLTNGPWSLSFRENIQTTAVWEIDDSTVRITDPFFTDYLPTSSTTSTIRFAVSNIEMPPTTAPTSTFTYESVLVDSGIDYVIDKSSYTDLISSTAGEINFAAVTPASTLANDLTTYTFNFTNKNDIVQDGKIQVDFPPEIILPSPSTTANSCRAISGVGTSLVCEATTSSLTINSGFSTGALPRNSLVVFEIDNVRNPVSLEQSSSFTIRTLSDDNFDIDSKSTAITVTMLTNNNITFIEVTPDSLINGALTTMIFNLTSSSPLQNGDYFYVVFPSEVQAPSLPITCSGVTALDNSLVCTKISTAPEVVQVELNFDSTTSVEANELLTFQMLGCTNPTTTEPSTTFLFFITNANNFTINNYGFPIFVTTTEAAELITPSLTSSNSVASASVNLEFTFTLRHDFPIAGVVYIYYPSSVGFNSSAFACQWVDPSSPGFVSTCTWSQETVGGEDRIVFENLFTSGFSGGTTLRITLFGLINPSTAGITDSFSIFTFTDNTSGYRIDKTESGLTLSPDCDYPCLTWGVSTSSCNSWITTTDPYKLQDDSCVLTCDQDKFYNATINTCEDCAPEWGAWSALDKTIWTKWGLVGFEFLRAGTWTDTWPGTFFGNTVNFTCDAWDNVSAHWLNCEGLASNCTSWDSTSAFKYLNNNVWVTSCPANTHIQNDTLGEWVPWDSNWGFWSGTTTNCTSWNGNMKLDLRTNTCNNTWESGLTIVTGDTWVAWNTSWATCAGTTTTCTSCGTNLVLTSSFTWEIDCLNTNEIVISDTWVSCTPTCTEWQGTITNCTSCATNYALYQNEWVSNCPLKYEDKNQVCEFVGLICPENYVPDELEESCIPTLKECVDGKVLNSDKTKCIPPGDIAPFPVACLALWLLIVVIAGKWRDRARSKFIGNLIPLLGLIEIPGFIVLAFTCLFAREYIITLIVVTAIIFAVGWNVLMYYLFKKHTRKDEDFQFFAKRYPKTVDILQFLCLFWSFRVLKFFYSGFFGLDTWMLSLPKAEESFMKFFRRVIILAFFIVHIPVYIACALGILTIMWGYQALIECIEIPLILLTILILTIIEGRWERNRLKDDPYLPLSGKKNFEDDIPVMSGVPLGHSLQKNMENEEESKADRATISHEAEQHYQREMEYDVELRKKALLSIVKHMKNPERRNSIFDDSRSIGNCTYFEEDKYESNQRRRKEKPRRRAFSFTELKSIDEEEEFLLSEESIESDYKDRRFEKDPPKIERRMSFPMRVEELENVENPIFHEAIDEYRSTLKQQHEDNCYADSKPPKPVVIVEPPVMAEMGTQTVLRDLLFDEESDEELERADHEDAEIESNFAGNLIGDVIDQLSETSLFREKKVLDADRLKEIPDFEIEDILGEFDIDDNGNYIIKLENGVMVDNNGKKVNGKGYFIDNDRNIINKKGEIIFYADEVGDDGQIPAPFVYEKLKNDFLSKAIRGKEVITIDPDYMVDDDEDLVEEELKKLRPSSRESSVESLVADNPGMYVEENLTKGKKSDLLGNESRLDAEKAARGRKTRISPHRNPLSQSDLDLARSYGGKPRGSIASKYKNHPQRIKRENTKELFPSLAIEDQAKNKLTKIVDNISKKDQESSISDKYERNQELKSRLNKLKEEHFKDLDSENFEELNMDLIEQKVDDFENRRQKEYEERMRKHMESGLGLFSQSPMQTNQYYPKRIPFQNSDLLPTTMNGGAPNTRPLLSKQEKRSKVRASKGLKKIYGNLGELVVPADSKENDQLSRLHSPGSWSTLKSGMSKNINRSRYESNSRIKGLEMIYLQKLEKRNKQNNARKRKAKFRTLYHKFVDHPSILAQDDDVTENHDDNMSRWEDRSENKVIKY